MPSICKLPPAGDTPSIHTMMTARTRFFDEVITQHSQSCTQLVILGAGFDTRAFTHGHGYEKIFEVDAPATQHMKKEMLEACGVHHPGHLVAVDFNTTNWLDALVESGFDKAKPTVVLCEGVTYYLNREAVHELFRSVALLAPGSVITFDYFGLNLIELPFVQFVMRMIGEPFTFGVQTSVPARSHIASLVRFCGLNLISFQPIGNENRRRGCLGGFVVAGLQANAKQA